MKYYKYLYIQDRLDKNKDRIIDKLNKDQLQLGIHLLVLSGNVNNHLEILDSKLLLQRSYPKDDLFVVGIAKGYNGAMEMLEEIVREVYNETGGANIRSYITEKERES